MSANSVLLRRGKILVHPDGTEDNLALAATFNSNLQALGYTLAPESLEAVRRLPLEEAGRLYSEVVPILQAERGLQHYRPMYPNFPQQVAEASDAELYWNAIHHYFVAWVKDVTGADVIWLPRYRKELRAPLEERVSLSVLRLGGEADLRAIATGITCANTSISQADAQDLRWLMENGYFTLPAVIPHKENAARVAAWLLESALAAGAKPAEVVAQLQPVVKTATDVLRLAAATSDGDVSLAKPTRFRNFSRPQRRVLLGLLEAAAKKLPLAEEMERHAERWLRLGERLHPGEFKDIYPGVAFSYSLLRLGVNLEGFNSQVERAVRTGEAQAAIALLSQRPGEYARRLDHLLRLTGPQNDLVLEGFSAVASGVATPVLLQVASHFKARAQDAGGRKLLIAFPKGATASAYARDDNRHPVDPIACEWAVDICERVLRERFAALPSLGKVYIDPELANYAVPASQRSASSSLRRLERGSKPAFGADKNTLRFFIWWRQQEHERTDLDLSAIMYSDDWQHRGHIAYFNLRSPSYDGFSALHSGDITDAPAGACEFIDIHLPSLASEGVRYVAMCVNSFTRQNFDSLAECSAGWMLRARPGSGEVFEPKTVTDKIDVSSHSTIVMPLVVDVTERRIIWADVAIRANQRFYNNIAGNFDSTTLVARSLAEGRRPNLQELFALHAAARGQEVDDPANADTVFSVASGTPFEIERITSEFLTNASEPHAPQPPALPASEPPPPSTPSSPFAFEI